MRRWILAVFMVAGAARAWTPGGHYPTGAGGVPAAVNDPLSGLVPYSMNVQVTGRISTNDVAVFTDRTGRYLRGTNLVHLLAGLAPAAINAGMSNYLVEVTGVATTAQARAELAVTLAEAATNLTAQAVAALGVQSNLTDTAYVAATNAAAEAVTAYAAATNAAAQAAAAYAAGTNAQATATAVEYLAAAGYAAGTNGQALAWAAGTNASAAAAAAGLAYVAATNAQAEAAAAAFDAALAAADLGTALAAATNAQEYAYIAMTNAVQAFALAELAAEGYAAGTNAAAQAGAVYAVATNAQALAQSAEISSGVALALAGSYYAIATNAAAVAAAAAADVDTAYTAATNAAAQAAAVYTLAADKSRLEGFTGVSTNLVWMDMEGLPGAGVTASVWRAYVPTALVWQVAAPLLTNSTGNPLVQTQMETQWWHSVPYPLEWPDSGPVIMTNRSSVGAIHSLTAVTNLTGGVDIYYGNTRATNYLASASAGEEAYLAGGPFEFSWLVEGLTGTVSMARGLPPATTGLVDTVAMQTWTAVLVAAQVNQLATEIYEYLWGPFEGHTNDLDNPHQVTPAQIGAATTGELAAVEAGLAAYATTQSVAAVEAALAGYQSAAYWPPNATASSWFTFTTNANEITITGYNIAGGTDVVIPDYINGWPVTAIGEAAFSPDYGGMAITSVVAPQAQTIGDYAFGYCTSLTSVSLPQATTIASFALANCQVLTSVSLPQATTIGNAAFIDCPVLTSVYFDSSAPTIGSDIFLDIPENQVTNYVTNPQATGWGETLGGMPVVRLPLYGDKIYQGGELVATTGHVAQAIAEIPAPDLSSKVDAVSGLASNLWLQGETIVSDSYTNLWWRNVFSNGWHWLVAYTNAPGGME